MFLVKIEEKEVFILYLARVLLSFSFCVIIDIHESVHIRIRFKKNFFTNKFFPLSCNGSLFVFIQ